MTLDLTDEESAALAALLRRTIADDRYPLSPRVRSLQAILDRIEPPRCASRCRRGRRMRRRGQPPPGDGADDVVRHTGQQPAEYIAPDKVACRPASSAYLGRTSLLVRGRIMGNQ
jgi:hypothetical protein